MTKPAPAFATVIIAGAVDGMVLVAGSVQPTADALEKLVRPPTSASVNTVLAVTAR
ncbi:hypothetical protein D3C81_2077310 [compost metagenome]